jgi:hypothetical protein
MRRVGTDGLRFGGSARLCAGALVALVWGCRARFTGPYPCEPDYASCVEPSRNACETNTSTDGLNCGSCGKTCGVGALCVGSQCGRAATPLAALAPGSQTLLKTNSSAVFWSASNGIFMLPASASQNGTPQTIATDGTTCGNGGPSFAVDDANLYYWSSGFSCAGTGGCSGLTQVSLADGTRTVLVPPPMSGQANPCGTFAVGATSVYLLARQQQGNVATYTLYSALIGVAGQTAKTLVSVPSYNGSSTGELAINSTALFFEITGANNVPSLEVIPIDGGPMTTLPIGVNTYWFGWPFVADDANLYAVGGGCVCNNNNNNNNNGSSGLPPAGTVVKVPLGGRPSTTLATFSGEAGGIAVDSTHVYWSTDTTAWKVPIAGGVSTPVAGNLANGAVPVLCVSCGGGGSQNLPTAIAVGPSGAYIAVTGSNENAILEVAK